jgi:hypothetical protein
MKTAHLGLLVGTGCFLAIVGFAGCDPDTTPVGGGGADQDSGSDADSSAAGKGGTGGTAGQGGSAGNAGTAGTAGAGGLAEDAGEAGDEDVVAEGGEEAGGSAGEAGQGGGGAGGTGGSTGYSHSITVDGVNDFDTAKDRFATSSTNPNYFGYIAWDHNFVYLGMEGSSIADKGESDWVIAYLGGTPGSQQGIKYNNQQPSLPFEARFHVRWKCNGQYTNVQRWDSNASTWTDATWNAVAKSNSTFMEMSIPRIELQTPDTIKLLMAMMRESIGSEWTWAGVPSNTLIVDGGVSDGVDPNFGKYFEFDFAAATAPNAYSAKP